MDIRFNVAGSLRFSLVSTLSIRLSSLDIRFELANILSAYRLR